MKKVFEKPEDLSDYLFRIIDNGGSSADRYTVVFSDGSYLAMSSSPTSPQGISISDEGIDPQVLEDWTEEGQAVELALGDLPEHLVQHIMSRNNEGLEDFLEAVENKEPNAVAPNREAAEANEGGSNCLGTGIYVQDDKYWVKLDENDDRGPYETAREVILASMPDAYSLSGPEYHSGVDVMRMTPDPDVLKAVEALETRRDAEWKAEMDRRYP